MLKEIRETVSFEIESGEICPIEFVYPTEFYRLVLWHNSRVPSDDDINHIFEYLDLSVEPLEKFAREDGPPLEDRIDWYGDSEYIRKSWQAAIDKNEAAWQSLDDIMNCIKAVIEGLNQHQDIFSKLNIETDYFVKGHFKQDLIRLLEMTDWAQSRNIDRVRLKVSDGIIDRNQLKEAKERLDKIRDSDHHMPPPWLVFPEYSPSTIGWRMGVGESYMMKWRLEYDKFGSEEKKKYKKKYPAPLYWFYFYWPENIFLLILMLPLALLTFPFRLLIQSLYKILWSSTGKTVKYS